jgi:hypothetical protein
MNTGSFTQGILGVTNWVGNAIMPVLAALMIALGIYRFSRGGDFERYVWGAMGALSVSGLLRLGEVFAGQAAGTNQIFQAVLTLADWVCNVILPVYGSLEIVRAVLGWSGVGSRLNIGDDWMRHVAAAMAAFCCSGILRLFEHFIAAGINGVA